MIDLEEAKMYLRVDSGDDDTLIESLIETATEHVHDLTRLDEAEFEKQGSKVRIAILYMVAYLYENREKANHKELNLTLRSLLFGVREDKF